MHKTWTVNREWKYAVASTTSIVLVFIIHIIHLIAIPLLTVGSLAIQHDHHMNHSSGSESTWMILMMVLLVVFSSIGMFFAARQLIMAWQEKNRTHHTYISSAISLFVLGIGIYTILSLL